jgi:phage-related protein
MIGVVRRVRGIAATIQSDIIDTVKGIGDAVTIQLPFAAELIEKGFNLIGKTMSDFFKAPLQSMSQLTRAVLKIRQGLLFALESKDEIKENLRLLGNA